MVFFTSAAYAGEQAQDPPMSVTMIVQNLDGPFVTRHFAERLARLLIEEKCTRDIFAVRSATVTDADRM